MVAYCAVSGCNNSLGLKPNLRFHRFPKNEYLQTEWLKACGFDLHPENDTSKLKLCSEHFEKSNFRITRPNGPLILKPDGIPSLMFKKTTKSVSSIKRFPKSPELCARWVEVVNREGWQPTSYSRICSDHFQKSDFTPTRRLKAEAVPIKYSQPKPQQTPRNIVLIPCNCISNSDVPVHNFQVVEDSESEPNMVLPEFHNCGIHTDNDDPLLDQQELKTEILLDLDSGVCSNAVNSQPIDQQLEPIEASPDLNSSIYSNNTSEHNSQMIVDQSLVKIEVLPDENTSPCYENDSQMVNQVQNVNNEFAAEKNVIYRRSKGTQTAPKFDVLSQTEKVVKMKTKIKTLQRTLQRREKQLKAVKDLLEQMSVQSSVTTDSQAILQGHFTDVMKDLISQELNVTNQPKSGRRYTDNIKEFSLTLYSYSPKAYEFVSNFIGLPCLRSIKSWQEHGTNPISCSLGDDD